MLLIVLWMPEALAHDAHITTTSGVISFYCFLKSVPPKVNPPPNATSPTTVFALIDGKSSTRIRRNECVDEMLLDPLVRFYGFRSSVPPKVNPPPNATSPTTVFDLIDGKSSKRASGIEFEDVFP
jgi:hypothetical protein